MNLDADSPLAILDQEIDHLKRLVLKDESTSFPFWKTREEAIAHTIREIKNTLDEIEKHGNRLA